MFPFSIKREIRTFHVVFVHGKEITVSLRRRQRENHAQKSSRLRLAKQQFCTCITLFCTFLCCHCTTTTWIASFHVLSTTWTCDDEFLFLSLNLNTFLNNSTPWKFAYIGKSERAGIIALKFQRTRSHFLSDVFAAVAVVVSYILNSLIRACASAVGPDRQRGQLFSH